MFIKCFLIYGDLFNLFIIMLLNISVGNYIFFFVGSEKIVYFFSVFNRIILG